MNITYFIQCHKNFEQVTLLIESLHLSNGDNVVIHVDKKNETLKLLLTSYYVGNEQVYIIKDPVSVSWSGFSQVQATLKMINFIYNNNICFDYCCLLSGEDIVLRVQDFKEYLKSNSGLSFIEFRDEREVYLWRINKFNLLRDFRFSQSYLFRAISSFIIKFQSFTGVKRSNFNDDDIYIGSQWFTIHKRHMDLFVKVIDGNFLNRFKYTSCADEHFFQMLFKAYISPLEFSCINLRYIDFPHGSSSPRYLSITELNNIKYMQDIFIARKVTLNVASEFFCHK